ncbi:hypothetical protein [Paenibacillus lautus]|uniref:hypothetical protein n=1 Tax=Paenibacillus lautus TaxID=1401 RepID=UPI003D2D5EB6
MKNLRARLLLLMSSIAIATCCFLMLEQSSTAKQISENKIKTIEFERNSPAEERATLDNQVITDRKKLEKIAKNEDLDSVPIRIETEYSGP